MNPLNRPDDITLPDGWTWDDVEAQRAKWGIADNMIPIASAGGVVAWGTINSVRNERVPEPCQTDKVDIYDNKRPTHAA